MKNFILSEGPLICYLCIHEVKGKVIDSKPSPVELLTLMNMSMIIRSSLTFPLSEDVIYQVKVTVFEIEIELYGTIEASICSTSGETNHYELKYILSDKKKMNHHHLLAHHQDYDQLKDTNIK